MKPGIYDSSAAKDLSLSKLLRIFADLGVERVLYKKLSPNDNSKNQVYLAGHLTELGFLPTGNIVETASTSKKTENPKRRIKFTAPVSLCWIAPDGASYPAPQTKLIYYPQYPEVRLSGFLAGVGFDMAGWMAPEKRGRTEGRVLLLGIHKAGKVCAYLASPESSIAREIRSRIAVVFSGVLCELELDGKSKRISARELLLAELRRIHEKGWIQSKRLDKSGNVIAFNAANGGGFTLEAELGIVPNGLAEPDFHGWEVKQFGVDRCELIDSKVLTLMTPEPDGGFYVTAGVEAFVRKYGYKSTKTHDRFDFTGKHLYGAVCARTNLKLVAPGYDAVSHQITSAGGYVGLIDKFDNLASKWSFAKLMQHWKTKHANAVYVPSLSRGESQGTRAYFYCRNVRLFSGTTPLQLLQAIACMNVYYDPGIKLTEASSKPATKRRNQFRIRSIALGSLYTTHEEIDVSAEWGPT